MSDWNAVRLTARKITAYVPVPLDTDGTPLHHGERMVEVEPGHWMDPTLAAIMDYLAAATDGQGTPAA